MRDGAIITVDNTRVLAAHKVGIKAKAIIRNYDELLSKNMSIRFTTKKMEFQKLGKRLSNSELKNKIRYIAKVIQMVQIL
jgi:hypothetical protein